MRHNFIESYVVVFKQIREDKYLETIYTFADAATTDGGSWYIGK